jgi:hypothetical protein
MESPIVRSPTEEERKDFIPLADPKIRFKNPTEKFIEELCKQEQIASKKRLPFAAQVATNEFNDYYKNLVQTHMRKYGYVKFEEVKAIKMDWNKYSDLKNFELVDEGEKYDEDLSKSNPGLNVMIEFKKYKHKEYDLFYQVNEDRASAIARAKKKAKE